MDTNANINTTEIEQEYNANWTHAQIADNLVKDFGSMVGAEATAGGVITSGAANWQHFQQVPFPLTGAGTSTSAVIGAGGLAAGVPPPPARHPVPRAAGGGAIEVQTTTGQVIKLEGEYEQFTSGGETVTRKVKEQDVVKSPKFPSITNLRQWHNTQARFLILAGGRADGAEAVWWNAILADGSKFDDFADVSDKC